jgi:hypothetical protein
VKLGAGGKSLDRALDGEESHDDKVGLHEIMGDILFDKPNRKM